MHSEKFDTGKKIIIFLK